MVLVGWLALLVVTCSAVAVVLPCPDDALIKRTTTLSLEAAYFIQDPEAHQDFACGFDGLQEFSYHLDAYTRLHKMISTDPSFKHGHGEVWKCKTRDNSIFAVDLTLSDPSKDFVGFEDFYASYMKAGLAILYANGVEPSDDALATTGDYRGHEEDLSTNEEGRKGVLHALRNLDEDIAQLEISSNHLGKLEEEVWGNARQKEVANHVAIGSRVTGDVLTTAGFIAIVIPGGLVATPFLLVAGYSAKAVQVTAGSHAWTNLGDAAAAVTEATLGYTLKYAAVATAAVGTGGLSFAFLLASTARSLAVVEANAVTAYGVYDWQMAANHVKALKAQGEFKDENEFQQNLRKAVHQDRRHRGRETCAFPSIEDILLLFTGARKPNPFRSKGPPKSNPDLYPKVSNRR